MNAFPVSGIIKETEKALLVKFTRIGTVWIPKSQIFRQTENEMILLEFASELVVKQKVITLNKRKG